MLQAAIQGKLVKQLGTDRSVDDYLTQISDRKAILIKNKEIKKEPVLSDYANDEIQFEIPNNWRWVKLGNLCSKIGAGSTPRGGAINYVIEGVPFIREQNVYSSGLLYSGMVYITEELNELKAGSMVKPNDLLLNITGGSIGRCAITPNDFVTGNVNQHVLIIRLVDVAIIKYIHAVINSPYFQKQIREKAKGDKEGLSATSTKNFLVPFPPIEEQQRIVDKINEIMLKIDEYEKIEKELETLKKEFPIDMKDALLQAAMQGKLTEQLESDSSVDELLVVIQREKEELIAQKKIKREKPLSDIEEEEIPFDIPENWRWVRWGNLAYSIQYGYNAPAQESGKIKMVRISDIQDNSVNWNSIPYCDISDEEIETYLLKENDILFARTGGTVGKSFLVSNVPEDAIYAGYLIRTRYNNQLIPRYLKLFMESQLYWVQLQNGKTQGCQPNCNGQTLSKMMIPLPPKEEQQRIVERLDLLLPLCEDLRE